MSTHSPDYLRFSSSPCNLGRCDHAASSLYLVVLIHPIVGEKVPDPCSGLGLLVKIDYLDFVVFIVRFLVFGLSSHGAQVPEDYAEKELRYVAADVASNEDILAEKFSPACLQISLRDASFDEIAHHDQNERAGMDN